MDLERIPEPIILTAAVAMFQANEDAMDVCSLISKQALKSQRTDEMKNTVNGLKDQFLSATPPGFDDPMTGEKAEKLALAVVGIGGVLTLSDALHDLVFETIESVVAGTAAAIQNFGNFVAENE